MQTVAAGWTAEERDSVRRIAHDLRISWKKDSLLGNRTFTIGISTIGGNDLIGANPGAIGSPGNYRYFDESDYVMSMAWERGLNMPVGGLTKALAEVHLDNTSGRFTPRYMGGSSELYTAILPQRPVSFGAGFYLNGVDQTITQFSGQFSKQPKVNARDKSVLAQADDYIGYFEGKFLDQSAVYTSKPTDYIMEQLLQSELGMSTAQYDLDSGINIIPFAYFDAGASMAQVFRELAQAEYGHFYQDEEGIFKFRNRQWGDSSPYNAVQRVISTGQVISAESPDDDHIINVVEVKSNVYQKQPIQTIFTMPSLTTITIPGNGSVDQFFEFQDPVLEMTAPTGGGADSYYLANTSADGAGSDITSNISVSVQGVFNKSAKLRFTNSSSTGGFITQLVIAGRVAKNTSEIYLRVQDDSSVTAFSEKPYMLNNRYIQDETWATNLAQLILNDFAEPENLQNIVIRAIPELQLFDLISWQGRYWRVFNIRSTLDPTQGYIQELTLLQRTVRTYFRIGISTIGGTDAIAP